MRSMEGLPTYNTVEVAKHSTVEDAWIVIDDKVLDISTWLEEHPGGDDVLLDLAGRDATREFEDVGHSGDARSRLDTLIIGTVRTSTDDELRASRAGSGATGKSLEELMVSREVVYEWVKDHLNSFKRAGTIGLASVAVFAAAMFLKRYGSRLLPSSRR